MSRVDACNVNSKSRGEAATDPPARPLPPARMWLLDGFNILHVSLLGGRERTNWWGAAERMRLIERVRTFRAPAEAIWLVFDGPRALEDQEREDVSDPLRVVFAPSADRWLWRRVCRAPQPARLAVVSADRQLGGRCRHAGAHVVAPRDFIAQCSASPDPK